MIKLTNIVESIIKPERDMFEGFNEEQLGEEYPQGFSLNEFKNIRSYVNKIKYARQYLGKPLGKGTSRIVFRVDETKVLKLAINRKGIAQNEVEINWYGETYYDDLLAQVLDFDRENNLWVEMELAYRAKESDFKRLFGVDINPLNLYVRNWYEENRGRSKFYHLDKEIKEVMDENDNVQHLVSFMNDSEALPGDLTKLSSWGIVKRQYGETIVLIDFGFTNEVYKSYYS